MTFKEFVDRMLNDDGFRHAVRMDPKKALQSAGMRPTKAQIDSLKEIDFQSLEKMARAFGEEVIT